MRMGRVRAFLPLWPMRATTAARMHPMGSCTILSLLYYSANLCALSSQVAGGKDLLAGAQRWAQVPGQPVEFPAGYRKSACGEFPRVSVSCARKPPASQVHKPRDAVPAGAPSCETARRLTPLTSPPPGPPRARQPCHCSSGVIDERDLQRGGVVGSGSSAS